MVTNGRDNVANDTCSDIQALAQRATILALVYSYHLRTRVLPPGQVYDEAQFKGLYIERLQSSTFHSIDAY